MTNPGCELHRDKWDGRLADCPYCDIKQLRGKLSLAEDGLTASTQKIEALDQLCQMHERELKDANAEIERQRTEIRALDQANGQAVEENERLRSVLDRVHGTLRMYSRETADAYEADIAAPRTAHEPLPARADQWTPEEMARFRMQQAQNMCQGCFRPVSACVCASLKSAAPAETPSQHTHEGNQTAGVADSIVRGAEFVIPPPPKSEEQRECQCATYCMANAGMKWDPPVKCRGLTGEDPGAHLRFPRR